MPVNWGLSKRSQVSLEFFLVMMFFALTLFWFNNYYNQLRSQDLVFVQQKALLEQIVVLEGEAFSSNQTLSFNTPCLAYEGKAVPFWVYADGGNETELLTVVRASRRSMGTVFPVTASPNPLFFECDGNYSGKLVFSRERIANEEVVVLKKG